MYTKDIILSYLSLGLSGQLSRISKGFFEQMTELRIRADKPLLIYCLGEEHAVGTNGLQSSLLQAYHPTSSDIAETVERISQYSLYALEEELRMGYITLPGGHRIGIVGRAVVEAGKLRTIRPISGLNIRISRAIVGCGDTIVPKIMDSHGKPYNTMIISPPGCGKTTLLRDIIRQLSDNIGLTIGVVDERSEIGGSYKGLQQNDLGIRTDLLDGCPKAEGMVLLLRAMAPDVIAVDELGSEADTAAVENVSNAGVRLLCTVHGYDLKDIYVKPNLSALLEKGIFKRFVMLSAPGKEGVVYDGN